ncbi:MAG: redox-sensing transcriptional repressor Rex [Treponema sp.]|jgi:redox-sensing transcriptional repressor|nr:redox-sensing transcriptional repressor Rex [Treponema sp.]
MQNLKISAAFSIRRLPSYLHIIRNLRREGEKYILGAAIARELHLESIQVRKDLGITGIKGKPGKGYPAEVLVDAIEGFLGWNIPRDAIIAGVGNLGSALIGYEEFQLNGLNIVAGFDIDPEKIGAAIHGVPVLNTTTIAINVPLLHVKIAILTVPDIYAQDVSDTLVDAGINAIWNFTNTQLRVPSHVVVQNEDFSLGYDMLCIKMRSKRSLMVY